MNEIVMGVREKNKIVPSVLFPPIIISSCPWRMNWQISS